ncbi:MAG: class I SAM-dependent methyltransferase [Planctomycetota bacterium]
MPERLEWQGHAGAALDRAGEFTVIECEPCGFRHVIPLPAADELREIYRQEYYTAEKPLYLERAREDLDWWRQLYAERFDAFEALLGGRTGRLLDVGSGPGFLLEYGRERGWEVLGVEPSAAAAAHARGLGVEVVEEFLTPELAPRLGRFDAVHLSEVLEHVPDPRSILALCRDLTRPGGLVCASVPNDYNPFQHALRTSGGYGPWWVAPPHHLNYFEFASLERLFARAGLEPVRRDTTFPIDMFLLMGEDYVGNDALGRVCHGRRMAFERHLRAAGLEELLRTLYQGLAQHGLGRLAVVTARRR